MRRFWSNAFTIVVVGGLALLGVAAAAQQAFYRAGPLAEARVVEVTRGESLSAIARDLEEQGVISSALLFKAAARVLGVSSAIKAGDYAITPGAPMADVMNVMTEGRAIQHRVTVAEGLTVQQVADLVRENPVLTGEIESLPPEGMLAPDTYFVHRGETRQAIIDRMHDAQMTRLTALWDSRSEDLPIASPDEAMILASIVEKETGVSSERAMVASVFVNRLRKGMRLQTDPTVIYGITRGAGPLGRSITRSDLDTATEYNTYLIDGLPPTPIANPGRKAIEATLNPAESEFLYFVADGGGGHVFAKSLREHNRNVAQWRKIELERRKAAGG